MFSRELIEEVLNEALLTGGDFSEIFLENTFNNGISMGDRKIEGASSSVDYGAGIRVFLGDFYSYVTTNDLSKEGLIKAARKVAMAINNPHKFGNIILMEQKIENINPVLFAPSDISRKEKIDILENITTKSHQHSKFVKRVDATIKDTVQNVVIANSDGLYVKDMRTYSSVGLSVMSDNGKEQVDFFKRKGAHQGFEFIRDIDLNIFSEYVVLNSVDLLAAINGPAGKIPVVLGVEGGVLFHEACGHSLEATAIAKKASNFYGKLGQKIASTKVTLVDDGTIPNAWGSLNVDDEGHKTQRNVLIENGISKGYLVDRFNGRKMGMKATGSSRRQSYAFAPTSRMNNTFIMPGTDKFEDMIKDIKYGLYISSLGGGSVNTATGDFNFSATMARIIENGKIGAVVKGAKLIGNGEEVLNNIDMVGDDFAMPSVGMCGSVSGFVPVVIGQPSLRISSITVGGQK